MKAEDNNVYQLPKYYFPRRFFLIILGFFALLCCFIVRVLLSVTVISIQRELGFDNIYKGVLMSSFFMGYLITQFLAQPFCDRFGGSKTLLVGITISILTTFITPVSAPNRAGVIFVRILAGLAQGITFPSLNWLICRHFPLKQKALSASIIWGGIYGGTIVSSFLSPICLQYLDWRRTFYVFGGVMLLWSVLWAILIRDDPKDIIFKIHPNELALISNKEPIDTSSNQTSPMPWMPASARKYSKAWQTVRPTQSLNISINNSNTNLVDHQPHHDETLENDKNTIELKVESPTSIVTQSETDQQPIVELTYWEVLLKLLKSQGMQTLIFVNLTCNWTWSMLMFWYPTWLSKMLGYSIGSKFAFFNALPFMFCFAVAVSSGIISDKLLSRGVPKVYLRKLFGSLCYLVPGIFLLILALLPDDHTNAKIGLMTVVIAANGFNACGSNLATLDFSLKYGAICMSIQNVIIAITNIIGICIAGVFLSVFNGNWNPIFIISAALYIFGSIVWAIFLKTDLVV